MVTMSEAPVTPDTAAGAPTGDAGAEQEAALTLTPQGDVGFAALMDHLDAAENKDKAAEGGTEAGAAAATGGQPPAAGEGAAKPDADAGAPAGGDEGKPPVAGATDGGAGGEDKSAEAGGTVAAGTEGAAATGLPADWTRPTAELDGELAKLNTEYEAASAKQFHEAAVEDVKKDYAPFFERLEQHPRALVGEEVPDLRPNAKPGAKEVLRDEADVKSWQEMVKGLLVDEVKERATKAIETNQAAISTVHQSIQLFQNNKDLRPGTAEFDKDLADRLATITKPYELRVDGKLHGFTIPIQPLVDNIRTALKTEREAAAKPPADQPASETGKPGEEKKVDPPQVGIQSKSGVSEEKEDFSTLFGTIGIDVPRF